MSAKFQEDSGLHVKVFGLPPGAPDHHGLVTKAIVSAPSALQNDVFEALDKA